MFALYFLIAFAAGCAISVQAAVNAQLASGIGGNVFGAAFYSFASGAVVLGLVAFLHGGLANAVAALPSQAPWKLIGGVLGAGAIFSTVILAPRIGLANLLILVIAGQLVTSLLIDKFGLLNSPLLPVTQVKLWGAVFVIGGALMTLFGDRILSWLSHTA
ncbi:DMT family transporter [Rhizobium glycinendophyticum]|uniref:DMT family transporter n=1 Tax=Rhizobium glycinendophyticum TaxID=2589807 RepID=A0A504UDV7_9HYPH|nr:DMT family transporter [Rhizobium glycinendophyticum]TPP05031.1 DMT family transporter [Rhizobium glycinendophyticum]